MPDRAAELLAKAADVFADGRMIDHAFLVDNEVTPDEATTLLEDLAEAAREHAIGIA